MNGNKNQESTTSGTLIGPEEMARALSVSIRSLRDWTARGKVPVRYLGRLPRYCLKEVFDALPRRRTTTTATDPK